MFSYELKAYLATDSEPLQAFLATVPDDLEQSPHHDTVLDEAFEVSQKNAKSRLRADKLEAKAERLAALSDSTNPPQHVKDFLSL